IYGGGFAGGRRRICWQWMCVAAERWRSPGEVTAASDRWFRGGDDMVVGDYSGGGGERIRVSGAAETVAAAAAVDKVGNDDNVVKEVTVVDSVRVKRYWVGLVVTTVVSGWWWYWWVEWS
nr:hypothetical protein [Tanacetum cinerariifolium]